MLKVIDRSPDEILSDLAYMYRRQRPEQAVELWMAAAKLDETNGLYTYRAGKTLMSLGRYAEAADQLRRSLERVPDHVPTRYCRAKSLARDGAFDEAIEEAKAVVAAQPQNAAAQSLLLHALVLSRRFDEALASYPDPKTHHLSRADILAHLVASHGRRQAPPASELTPGIRKQLASVLKEDVGSAAWTAKLMRFLLKCSSKAGP